MSNVLFYIIVAFITTAGVSFLAAFLSRFVARQIGAIDIPSGGRKIHTKPTPLWGGVGIGLVIIGMVAVIISLGMEDAAWLGRGIIPEQLGGFILGLLILVIGGALDDVLDLPPHMQIVFPALASIVVILSGTQISLLTNWTGGPGIALGWLAMPLTFAWLMLVTYAMKFMDGIDGLVTGQAFIGAMLIALLSLTTPFYHHLVALLAVIVAGAYLGFLPHNFHPSKQFLGEAGSTLAGFTLGFLAIIGGAKLATGLMALGFPLIDAMVVVIGRVSRGSSPFKGDDTHLHFKLLRAGLSQRQTVGLIWFISLAFGLAALGLQTRGKIMLLLVLALATALISYYAGKKRTA